MVLLILILSHQESKKEEIKLMNLEKDKLYFKTSLIKEKVNKRDGHKFNMNIELLKTWLKTSESLSNKDSDLVMEISLRPALTCSYQFLANLDHSQMNLKVLLMDMVLYSPFLLKCLNKTLKLMVTKLWLIISFKSSTELKKILITLFLLKEKLKEKELQIMKNLVPVFKDKSPVFKVKWLL